MKTQMQTFFFTYGTADHFPYRGGWSMVIAPDRQSAVGLFRLFHPDHTEGIVNCADIYDCASFTKTSMWYKVDGNLGARCHECISIERELYTK